MVSFGIFQVRVRSYQRRFLRLKHLRDFDNIMVVISANLNLPKCRKQFQKLSGNLFLKRCPFEMSHRIVLTYWASSGAALNMCRFRRRPWKPGHGLPKKPSTSPHCASRWRLLSKVKFDYRKLNVCKSAFPREQ